MRRSAFAILVTVVLAAAALAQPRQYISVSSPRSGDNWQRTTTHSILWSSNVGGNVAIQLYRRVNEQEDFTLTIAASTPNDGRFSWLVPQETPIGSTYHVLVSSLETDTVFGWSEGYFTISLPPRMTVLSPNGGENWLLGSIHYITWTDVISGPVRIDLFRGEILDTLITASTGNTGSFTWHIPSTLEEGDSFRVRVRGTGDSTAEDFSDSVFTLSLPPDITLLSPNGGETWMVGDTATIRWSSVNLPEEVHIDFKRNYPSSNWINITSSTPNTGNFRWVVTGPPTTTARMRISGTVHTAVSDTSDGNFTIAQELQPPRVVICSAPGEERLLWNSVGGARYYEVYDSPLFGMGYELFAVTADTTVPIDVSERPIRFYYVVAVH